MKTKPIVTKSIDPDKNREQLNTEPPISEKDEVKQAEKRTAKATGRKPNN